MSSMTKDEFRTAFFLGERYGQKNPDIQDLACNVFAEKIVLLDLLIEHTKDKKLKENLQTVRNIILKRGQALWIMKADVVTNLSIKVGMNIQKVSLKDK